MRNNLWKSNAPVLWAAGALRHESPNVSSQPADHSSCHEVDDALVAAVDLGEAGHFGLKQQSLVLQLASNHYHLLRVNCLGNRRYEIDSALKVDRRQTFRLHPDWIAAAHVEQLLFRNLHFDHDVRNVHDLTQFVTGLEVLVDLTFDERRRHNPINLCTNFRFYQFLFE